MAGLNGGVTLALLGVLLLGAALLPRGAGGECGSASARGAEWPCWPASLLQAGRVRRCAGGAGCRVGAGTALIERHRWRGVPGTAQPRGAPRSGAVAVPSWIPSDLDLGPGGGTWECPRVRRPAVEGMSPTPTQKEKRRARGGRAPGTAEVARRALGVSTWITVRAWAGWTWEELSALAHPLPPRLGQREGARKQ